MTRNPLAIVSLTLLCSSSMATFPGAAAAQPPEDSTALEELGIPEDVLESVARARERMESNDVTGAIAELEPLLEREDAPMPALTLLGTLYLENGEAEQALRVLEPIAEATEEPAVLYQAARAARATGQMDRFEAYLERSVVGQAATPASRELGLLRAQQGRYVEAYRMLRPWADARPEDTEARTAAALCAVNLERLSEAEVLLSDLDQSEPRVRLLWGRMLLLRGDPRGAISTLRPLLELEGASISAEARRILAEAYVDVGESGRAVETLQGHTEGRPLLALRLAQARYQSGDLEGAIRSLEPWSEELGEPKPDLPPDLVAEIAREYGRFLTARGDHELSIPYLERATALSPDDKQSWQALGQALAAVGRIEEAKEALARFSRLAEEDGPASRRHSDRQRDLDDATARVLQQAAAAMSEGRLEDAIRALEEETSLAPSDPRPRIYLSRALLLAGRNEAALAQAEEALALAPEDADALYQRGTVRLARREMAEAEADFRGAIERAPGHAPAMNDLAVLLMLTDRRDEARTLLERVLEISPSDPQAAANLERLEGDSG